jgi:hypothetical protein
LSLKTDPEKISTPRNIFAHVYARTPKDAQAGRNRRKSSKSGSGSGERNSLERECRLEEMREQWSKNRIKLDWTEILYRMTLKDARGATSGGKSAER